MGSGGNNFNYFYREQTDQIGKFSAVQTYAYVLSGGFGSETPESPRLRHWLPVAYTARKHRELFNTAREDTRDLHTVARAVVTLLSDDHRFTSVAIRKQTVAVMTDTVADSQWHRQGKSNDRARFLSEIVLGTQEKD